MMEVKKLRKRPKSSNADDFDGEISSLARKKAKVVDSGHKSKKVTFKLNENEESDTENESVGLEEEPEEETPLVKKKTTKGAAVKRSEAKKAMKIKRKRGNDNYSLITEAKRIWEILRRGDTPKDTRATLCLKLYDIVKGKAKDLIRKHDTGRVLQCLMIYATPDICGCLFDELKDHILELSKSRYSKHFLLKILRHGTKEQKNAILDAFRGHIVKHVRQIDSAFVIEFAYNQHANAQQRASMTQEFYGPSFALFNDGTRTVLADILKDDPSKKPAILSNLKENLAPILDKSMLVHTIVQHVLLEYITHCAPQDRSEMIESTRELIVEILHTPDGAKIALQCIWNGSVKDRKVIVKSMKGHVTKICKEKCGHLVLLTIFDCVDDTKLVRTVLINELIANIGKVMRDSNGRRVLIYLLCQRNAKFFHKDTIKLLEQGDACATSKKDKDVRYSELLDAVSQPLLKYLAENVQEMISDKQSSVVVKFTLKYCKGDRTGIYDAIAKLIANPSNHGLMEIPCVHMLLKSIVKADKENEADLEKSFCGILLEILTPQVLEKWVKVNRCAFFLVSMLEAGMKPIKQKLLSLLKPFKVFLTENQNLVGQRVLSSKIGTSRTIVLRSSKRIPE